VNLRDRRRGRAGAAIRAAKPNVQSSGKAAESSAGIQREHPVQTRPPPMKNTTAIALALLSVLLTAACSASPSPEPSAGTPTPALPASLPKSDPAQQETLLAARAKINPRLPTDQAIDKARRLCGRLLGQSTEDQLIAAAKTRVQQGRPRPRGRGRPADPLSDRGQRVLPLALLTTRGEL
jgi:hypothetical protein